MSPEITVAIITGITTVTAAGVAGAWGSKTARQTKRAVGVPNGEGNVVQMLERLLINSGRTEEKIDTLDRRVNRLEQGKME